MAVDAVVRPVRRRMAAAAAAATLVWLALHALGFQRVTGVVRWLAARGLRPAGAADVLPVLLAIDTGAAWLPFRVACLERSLAAVLLLAVRRRGVTWQVGFRTPPFAMHAWLTDATGAIIGEHSSTSAYQPLVVAIPQLNGAPGDRLSYRGYRCRRLRHVGHRGRRLSNPAEQFSARH